LVDLGLVAPVAAEPVEPPIELPEDERLVWTSLIESSLPDTLANAIPMSLSRTMAALTRLELRGLVRSVAGRFERTLSGSKADR
jgi:predicted Rossmann fold nucleotide-binding protein DprA/Smf involved in DNA uptake